ncbi:hypothetical protein FNL56_18360 [Tardiphaga sp. vice304]|uniref:hypothetical protein n=1 Tax=Tardiphaga sp. vice304 TaxID=2592817 RepID=UPI0011620707|nr:hypothetical protein [Tardiphaga sp. vice304]QDM27872.1 hypothetical protein FNL56_18360 [Tardiphaga sp. vice304]
MATLEIQGKEVEVNDRFLKLSPQEQNAFVSQIASSLGVKPGNAGDSKPSAARSQVEDVVKGIGGGLVRGTAGTIGMVTDTLPAGINWLANKGEQLANWDTPEDQARRVVERRQNVTFPGASEALSTGNIQHGIETVTGPAYEPTTRAGKIASRAAEFVPGAMIGAPANIMRNAVAFGAVPGALSEIGGQTFEGSSLETPARIAGGLAGGVGAAIAMRPNTAENMVRSAVGRATLPQIDAAEQLFNRAQQMGIPISRPEALQSITNGSTKLGDLQHTLEGMGGMKEFYSQRPAQNEAAVGRTLDTIASPNPNPSKIGHTAGAAGENVVTQIRSAINNYTRPMYDAGGQHLVPPQVHAAMMGDPLFAETFNNIRRDPALNAMVQNAPDRSVRMYDAVAKELEQRSQNAAQPLNPQASQAVASVTGRLGGDIKDLAVASEHASANGPSSYQAALANQTRLRQQYLQPVLDGPIGKIAGQDTTTKAAVEALFPANPLPNSQDEIAQTMRALSRQRPGVANDLVRSHAEMTFNEAAQRLVSGGPNQSGGAKFAATLRGNQQQAANLEASVLALPNGQTVWQGFNELLNVMEAQQYRQATGSRTAFKIPGVEDLKSGGAINNAAQVVGGAGLSLPRKITNTIQNWNVGRNVDELADLLTSPEAADRFRQLARLPRGSTQYISVLGRISNIANESRRSKDGESNDERR